ncbi:MAG: hypothetical protein HY053_02680 [Proteobacteria bacterium]|nr:hypothetical protein [Pseudomonadota bacterium]
MSGILDAKREVAADDTTIEPGSGKTLVVLPPARTDRHTITLADGRKFVVLPKVWPTLARAFAPKGLK